MKNRINEFLFIFLVFGLSLLISCSGDLNFTLPEVDPLLAVQSFMDPERNSEFIVTIANPISESFIQMNPACQVNIYKNDHFYNSLNLDLTYFNHDNYTKNQLRFFPDSGLIFPEGSEYKVEVKYPGFETLTAITQKPKSVKIKDVTLRHFTGEMNKWYYDTPSKQLSSIDGTSSVIRDTSLIEFSITFDDPPETSDYYRIGVNWISTSTKPWNDRDFRLQYACEDLPDPVFMKYRFITSHPINYGWNNLETYEILWNDNNFNGQEHTIKILVPGASVIPNNVKYVISLYTLSEDYYKYMVDRWKYSKSENDPFAEPIKLHSNTSNNCGIFAFSSLDVDTVVFSKSK